MTLAIRHFPDKKKPCIVLEEGNQALVLGYLTDIKREKWLRMALMMENASQLAVQVNSLYDLNEIMENEDNERNKPSLQWECRHCGKLFRICTIFVVNVQKNYLEKHQSLLSRRKVTTNATLANITQAVSMTEVAVVIYVRNIRIGKVRDKG